jgi:hypothetical protein
MAWLGSRFGRRAARVAVLPLIALALVAGGCGGDDEDDAVTQKKLMMAQADADLQGFCEMKTSPDRETRGLLYIAVVKAVDRLIQARAQDPQLEVPIAKRNSEETVTQLVDKWAKDLKRCGADGRQQAQRLQQAATSS